MSYYAPCRRVLPDFQLQDQVDYPTEAFKFRQFSSPIAGPSTTRTAEEERSAKSNQVSSDYLIDVLPSLGVSKKGAPMTAVGNNE